MKKQHLLADLTLGSDLIPIEYPIEQNQTYYLGRGPEQSPKLQKQKRKIDPEFIIRLGEKYNPIRHQNKTLEGIIGSISRLQGILNNNNGQLSYKHMSTDSSTYYIPPDVAEDLKPFNPRNLGNYQVVPGEEIQVFPGGYLIFGEGYVTQITKPVDPQAEVSAKTQLVTKTTQIGISKPAHR